MAENPGIVQRAIVAVKYALTGAAPNGWFGPNTPLAPLAPPEVAGRQFDYPVAFNLNFRPRGSEKVGFDKLKALAQWDMLRSIIERQKDKMEGVEWAIKPRPMPGQKPKEADAECFAIQAFLERPDKIHDWGQWVRALLEQNLVLDAVSVYRRRTRGGQPYAFELLDGATIKPLMDQSGRRPEMPDAAFQQVLKGVPAVDYTSAELLYFPQNFRADSAYGFSRVEWIATTIETGIERLKSQKGYFTHGNLSDGFFEAPSGINPDQIAQVETMFNNLMQASVENRRLAPFLPGGFKFNPIGQPPLQNEFDEWLARIVCFPFGEAPTPFLKQQGLGHGSAQTEHGAAQAAGFGNLRGYVRRLMNVLIAEDFGRPDLEFAWIEEREDDPKVADEIQSQRVRDGRLTINEARDANGLEPVEGGDVPMVFTGSGPVPLASVGDDVQTGDAVTEDDAPAAPGADEQGDLSKAAPSTAERRLTAALNRYLVGKQREVIAALTTPMAKSSAEDGYEQQWTGAFESVDWSWSDFPRYVEPYLATIATGAGDDALKALNLFNSEVLSRMTAQAVEFAEARGAEMVGMRWVGDQLVPNGAWSIAETTREMVRKAITAAMAKGQSNQKLAAAVRESGAFGKARATTIARTETAIAETNGKRAGWKASGVVAGREWSAAPECCDECQLLDGTIVPLDEPFPGGLDVPAHPLCRCAELPVLPEDMPAAPTV